MGIFSLYVEKDINSGEFVLLDLMQDENVLLNFKYKDSKDIAKAFSTYSQSFSIPGSSNNIVALNYDFTPELVFNRPDYINAKIYINTKLFKVGFIKVGQAKYKEGKLSTIQIQFFTALTSLKDVIGDVTMTSLTALTTSMDWSDANVYDAITNEGDVIVPLISTNRIWTYLGGSSDVVYDSAGKFPKGIWKKELRPAIKFSKIMESIIEQYDLDIECPLFERSEYTRLYAWCNNFERDLTTPQIIYPEIPNPFPETTIFNWGILVDPIYPIFSIYQTAPTGVGAEFDIFMNVRTISGKDLQDVTCKVTMLDVFGNTIITFVATQYGGTSGTKLQGRGFLPTTGPYVVTPGTPLQFTLKLEFSEPVEENNNNDVIALGGSRMLYQLFVGAGGGTISSNDNPLVFNLKSLYDNLPSIKIIDFLSSFFKMFNISTLEDNVSHKLLWLTPQEFFSDGIEIDYTPYGNITDLTIKKQDKYGKYIFQHKQPAYTSSVAFKTANINNPNENEFGQLIYDTGNPYIKNEYKLETNFSIMVPRILEGTNLETYYGFTSADATIKSENSMDYFEYTPNNADFTIFYSNGLRQITTDDLFGHSYLPTSLGFYSPFTQSTQRILECHHVKLINGFESTYTTSITFKDDIEQEPTMFTPTGALTGWTYDKNLFSNYYTNQIYELNHPRIFLYEYNVILPSFEMDRFSLRNTVVLGNNRFKVVEAQLNLTNGKCNMVLSNIVE